MQLARASNVPLSSSVIRKTFLDFFCSEKGHRLVRSSPVLPFGDPTLAFVNAGMNQFKGVLLGTAQPPSSRVANSQKCVRVGGKHNDLALVGRDGSHHTFFEMLGNWSFGDYFKREACLMSWELLTKAYGLDPNALLVTYFGGDAALGLEPDLETRDIWREIGVPQERLLPGSVKDNFWEMGDSGPCGGCTEIHYLPQGKNLNYLELWNLVFIEYKREEDGSLQKLRSRCVDTGMGFERLVAVMQGKNSNYDTDLFAPLFRVIHSSAGCPEYSGLYAQDDVLGLDAAYRILADHCRMITACLADGFFPDQEGKLRGILRKALTVSRDVFRIEEVLLLDLSSVVADILLDAYPEMARNLPRIHHIISHEAELLRKLRSDTQSEWETLSRTEPQLMALSVGECPSLLPAYLSLKSTLGETLTTNGQLPPSIAWKMCETFGVPPHLAEELATALGLKLDMNALEAEVTKAKLESRKEIYKDDHGTVGGLSANVLQELREEVSITNDSFKYIYQRGFGEVPVFPDQSADIVALIVDGDLVNYVAPELLAIADCSIGVVLDRTNMYSEEGGQACDKGVITVEDRVKLEVRQVICASGYVVHWVRCNTLVKEGLRIHQQCKVEIDANRRRSLMNNHTATHLLNAALRQNFIVMEQKSSHVKPHKLSFDFSVYREGLSTQTLKQIEITVRNVIRHGVYVKRRSINSSELPAIQPLTLLPGETYSHSTVHIVEISSGYFLSREPCCGTHAILTSDLGDFIITACKSLSSSVKTIQAVTGDQATEARRNAAAFQKELAALERKVEHVLEGPSRNKEQVEACDSVLAVYLSSLRETNLLSHVVEEVLTAAVEAMRGRLKYSARTSLRSSMEVEMKEALAANKLPYLVHYLQCSSSLDSVPLQKASRLCPHLPSLIFARSGDLVKARCYVPQNLVTETFSAQLWMEPVLKELKAEGGPPRGQSPQLIFNMKGKKLTDSQLSAALKEAREFAASTL